MDQELDITVQVKQPRLEFAPESGNDVRFQYNVAVGIKKFGDMNFLIHDEMVVETEFDLEISQEVLLMNFKELQVSPAGMDGMTRQKPQFDSIGITSQEYAEFWNYQSQRA